MEPNSACQLTVVPFISWTHVPYRGGERENKRHDRLPLLPRAQGGRTKTPRAHRPTAKEVLGRLEGCEKRNTLDDVKLVVVAV